MSIARRLSSKQVTFWHMEEPPISGAAQDIRVAVIGRFRFIEPYPYTFVTTAKGRWCDRELVEVFLSEFRHWKREDIVERIKSGAITVNGKMIPQDYVIRSLDKISHTILRRECPVINDPIEKIGETDDFVAYLKPASVPLHASGGFHYNAMINRIPGRYRIVHRLDRVTSGIIVLAKSLDAARSFQVMLNTHTVKKTYIARVIGVFPEGEVVCDEPIDFTPENRQVMRVTPGGKESKTVFHRVSTNGKESIVECSPITGRTHQIRVHLSHLGFPISNDPVYGGKPEKFAAADKAALMEAEKRGLYPPDTAINPSDDAFMSIYLHSFSYESDVFDFRAPMPPWTELGSASKCSVE